MSANGLKTSLSPRPPLVPLGMFPQPLAGFAKCIDCCTSAYRMHELHAFSQSWWLQQQLQSEGRSQCLAGSPAPLQACTMTMSVSSIRGFFMSSIPHMSMCIHQDENRVPAVRAPGNSSWHKAVRVWQSSQQDCVPETFELSKHMC